MEYCVIDVATARAHGIEILPTQRQSNDKTKAVIHANMVTGIDVFNQLKRYQYDDPEFIELLNSAEWTPEEGAEVPDENFGKVKALQILNTETSSEINTYNLTSTEALEVKEMYPKWESGLSVNVGERYLYEDTLWEVIQAHTTQDNWKPSISTASLWKIVQVEHAGTLEDPIPYSQGMAFEKGKYYIQDGVTYLCILTTVTGYPNDLKDLPTIVQKV